ncbi:benzaldehyde dehydrogenase [Paraburkholderia sp. Ac-20347]|uniref:benzaldehyde dehydrogenase n=1 Tax=Paraburkholderia sp. Ac-20347 TaxID=2703892 RepID=UPI0032173BD5
MKAESILRVTEPATGEELARVGRASADDVSKAAMVAQQAQKAWAEMPLLERAAVFRRAAQIIERRTAELTEWIVRETGAVSPKAMFEIRLVINHMHEAAALLTQPKGLLLPCDGRGLSIARRIPLGVVGVISPFNFPFLLSSRAMTPALACGNAVVLKPDPRTPVVGGFLHAEILAEAGLPSGVLCVMPGDAEAGEALVTDPAVRMISFTGSTAAGRRVGELAGKHLKKVALELGGKNSLIILDDADMDLAVANGAWASWLHQGQICMSAGRHLVHERIAEEYVARMSEKAGQLPVGNPHTENVALGPLICAEQARRVNDLLNDTLAQGARLAAGGTSNGVFFPATVITGVTSEMRAFKEEIFGPIVSITTFSTDDEAVELANDTHYGLSAGIITGSMSRGKAIADRLRVGLVHVNDQTVNDDGFMPMGGQGSSGNGSRHGGPANIEELTQWQWLTLKDSAPRYPL